MKTNKNLVRVLSLGLIALMSALDKDGKKPVETGLRTLRKVDRVHRNVKSLKRLVG